MVKKGAERNAEARQPQSTLKLSGSAHHLLVILSSWTNMTQKGMIQKMLLECLENKPANLKKTIEEWMAEKYGSNWKEHLT